MPQGAPILPLLAPARRSVANFPPVKALAGVWVNVRDFLDAVRDGLPVPRHRNERSLAQYTVEEDKIYPKRMIVKGRPTPADS